MLLFDEKRKLKERRNGDQGPPRGCRERRADENRRQTSIAEISFHEWTWHFLRFRERARARAAAKAAAKAAE